MLYDPKWEKKSGELTVPNLIAWLELQPPEVAYNYYDATVCLVGQFLRAHGAFQNLGTLPDNIDVVANAADIKDWTFGAALERARAALSKAETR